MWRGGEEFVVAMLSLVTLKLVDDADFMEVKT